MIVYRIDNMSRQDNALTGVGAELYGGRWNEIGERAVYCASHRSLAFLEILAHVRQQSLFPVDRVMLQIELPIQNMMTVDPNSLMPGWSEATNYQHTSSVFSTHCQSKNQLGIYVPSAIVPEEFNIVLDPLHPMFSEVKVIAKKLIAWDKRLLA